MTGWFARLFGYAADTPARAPSLAERKVDRAIEVMDTAIDETKSLTEKLNAFYAKKGRDGFKAFMTDVALAEQLQRHAKRAYDD